MKFLLDIFLSSRKGLCAFLFFGVLLIVLTRMPQWTSPHLDLDGDEAILGLMAKHVYEGKAFPLFFYGQNYGLSFIETLAAASFFFCFGISTISLKASMLFLWCLGWIFFVLALDIFSNRKYAFFLSLFLIFCPAWNLWSMMARGGYITAFALFPLCLWLLGLVYRKKGNALFLGLCLGFSMGLLLLAQPLFFLAILPWTFLLLSQKFFFYANALASFSSIFVVVYFLSHSNAPFWSPQVLSVQESWNSLLSLRENLWAFFSGIYYLGDIEAYRGFSTILASSIWCIFAASVIFSMLYFFLKHKIFFLLYAPFFSYFGIIAISFFLFPFGCRYLLPLPCVMLLFFSQALVSWESSQKKSILVAILLLVLFSGAGACWEARQYSRSWNLTWNSPYTKAKEVLVQSLLENQIYYVYCMHPLFQWNLIWDSQEKIIARYNHARDRYPVYPKMVDDAFFNNQKVAIVGRDFQLETIVLFAHQMGVKSIPMKILPGGYFWISPVDIRLLKRLGFQLWEKKQ